MLMGKRSRESGEDGVDGNEDEFLTAQSPAKMIEVDESIRGEAALTTMQCSLPPHRPLTFASAEEFDVHYAKEHTNRCTACGKNFPSAHYLSLHIDENHNPVREELAIKGEKTYACFVEDCDKKCSTPQKRRFHLIDKHLFPKVYDFRIIDHGIDKANSLLRGSQRRRLSTNAISGRQRRQSLVSTSVPPSTQGNDTPAAKHSENQMADKPRSRGLEDRQDVDELQRSFAALRFVPSSVQARLRNKKGG